MFKIDVVNFYNSKINLPFSFFLFFKILVPKSDTCFVEFWNYETRIINAIHIHSR